MSDDDKAALKRYQEAFENALVFGAGEQAFLHTANVQGHTVVGPYRDGDKMRVDTFFAKPKKLV